MSRGFWFASAIYLVVLGMFAGMVLILGAIVAAVIFHSNSFVGEPLTHFAQGELMSEIFRRFSYIVDAMVVVVVLFEGYRYKKFHRDIVVQLGAIAFVFLGLMFGHYYLPDIVALQSQGAEATQSELFKSLHKASEIDFKLLLLSTLVLMWRNIGDAFRPAKG